MIKRKQKTRKRVALAAILSLFLTSAASTITVNAADLPKDSIKNDIKGDKISDEEAIKEAVRDIRGFFEQLKGIKAQSKAEGINLTKEQQKEYQTLYIQGMQTYKNAWGALFLLNRFDLLEAAIGTGEKDKPLAIATKEVRIDIQQTQQEFEQNESELKQQDVIDDATILRQLRNKNQGHLATNELTSALFNPDSNGSYKSLSELIRLLEKPNAMSPQNPNNEQTQKIIKQITLWFQIIQELTFKNLSDAQRGQILALKFAYKSVLSKTPDNKEAEQAQKIIETITQLHANTITKIMIDLGIYDDKHPLPYPEIPAVEEILKQTN